MSQDDDEATKAVVPDVETGAVVAGWSKTGPLEGDGKGVDTAEDGTGVLDTGDTIGDDVMLVDPGVVARVDRPVGAKVGGSVGGAPVSFCSSNSISTCIML